MLLWLAALVCTATGMLALGLRLGERRAWSRFERRYLRTVTAVDPKSSTVTVAPGLPKVGDVLVMR